MDTAIEQTKERDPARESPSHRADPLKAERATESLTSRRRAVLERDDVDDALEAVRKAAVATDA